MPENPPPIVPLLGAIIGISIANALQNALKWVLELLLVCVLALIGVGVLVYLINRLRRWHQEKVWYKQVDSRVYSFYYRFRGTVLSRLGIIGR